MASQISSCRGHERAFSPILLFVGVNLSIKTPPFERYDETHPGETRGCGAFNVTIYGDYSQV
ncbi:unnamed protein product [Eruca vesicaria subsp. sativa]|uniref:Uncharacterized protein n=1 Tax=Eruca vesicaria subsp. sativa TaxID=29727 RepID=A0ABC8M251_ERUVS|nr:unnamed protein product [Eruca vesicaria subsp. sativa]